MDDPTLPTVTFCYQYACQFTGSAHQAIDLLKISDLKTLQMFSEMYTRTQPTFDPTLVRAWLKSSTCQSRYRRVLNAYLAALERDPFDKQDD